MNTITALIIGSAVLSLNLATEPAALGAGPVSADGRFVAYTVPSYDQDASPESILFVRAIDGSSTKTLGRLPGQPVQIDWLGSDRILLGQSEQANAFRVMDISGKRLEDIALPLDCYALYMALSPDGHKIAFTGNSKSGAVERRGLFVYTIETGEVRCLTEGNIKTLAGWCPDARRLAIGVGGNTKDDQLEIVDAVSGKVEDTGAFGVGACWSPQGDLIACTTEVQRGGSWIAGIPTDGKLGIYNVQERKMRAVKGTEGARNPVWSPSGEVVAFLARDKLGIATRDGVLKTALCPIKGGVLPGGLQVGWIGDDAVCCLDRSRLIRFEVALRTFTTLARWEEPAPPELGPGDFKVVELPRVTVRYARFDRIFAEAYGRILGEALEVYESHGFKMPREVVLEAQIDPSSTRLWTDGKAGMFLHLKSKDLLAPAIRSGVFNIYGMCHELGHIAMYRNMENLAGLPDGVGEGWAHYAGSVIVTEVAGRLGKSIWPEYYDVAEVEGIGRLKKAAAKADPWDKLDSTSRAALVFYRMETEFGRDKVAAAMTAALSERPTGKALMPLVLAKLRAAVSNPTAADWVPQSVLVPYVEWKRVLRGFL